LNLHQKSQEIIRLHVQWVFQGGRLLLVNNLMKKQQFQIKGTHCPSCKRLIEKKVGGLSGVISVNVDFETGATDVFADRVILKDEIRECIAEMEYKVV